MRILQKTFMIVGGVILIVGLCTQKVDAFALGILLLMGSVLINPVSIDETLETGNKTQS